MWFRAAGSISLKCAGYKQEALELSPEICKNLLKKNDVNIKGRELRCIKTKSMMLFWHLIYLNICLNRRSLSNGVMSIWNGWWYVVVCRRHVMMQNLSYERRKIENQDLNYYWFRTAYIYLYSRESIEYLLRQKGFMDIAV